MIKAILIKLDKAIKTTESSGTFVEYNREAHSECSLYVRQGTEA